MIAASEYSMSFSCSVLWQGLLSAKEVSFSLISWNQQHVGLLVNKDYNDGFADSGCVDSDDRMVPCLELQTDCTCSHSYTMREER